jgi:hypothetical protein
MEIVQPKINISYTYEHVPTVAKFTLDDHRIRGIMGPFGSGKTSGCIWEIIRKSLQQKPGPDGIRHTRWAIVRNTFPQLNDTTIKSVLDWLPPIVFGNYRSAAHDYTITGFKGAKIELLFRALDKPEHVSNLLSLELTGVWVNEAREVPKVIIDALDGRIDRFPSNKDGGRTWTGMIMDTNPPDDESWWYKMFETDRPHNCMGFKQPSGLSPEAENICAVGKDPEDYPEGRRPGLTSDYYTNMQVGKDKTYVDVYIKGEYGYTKEGKPVYESCYNDNLHISDVPLLPVKGKELLLAFDFGLTPSCIIGQVTPKGFLNILDELISEGMGIQQFVRNIVKPLLNTKYKGIPVRVTGDPAGNQRAQTDEKTCFDVLRAENFMVSAAESNDLVARVGAVEGFLMRLTDGKPTFRMDPSIKVLRKGFNSGYCYRRIQGAGERYTEEPMKNAYSHPHDALQYLCQFITGAITKAAKSSAKPKRRKRYTPASPKGGY